MFVNAVQPSSSGRPLEPVCNHDHEDGAGFDSQVPGGDVERRWADVLSVHLAARQLPVLGLFPSRHNISSSAFPPDRLQRHAAERRGESYKSYILLVASRFNPFTSTLKPQRNRPLYSNTVIGTLVHINHRHRLITLENFRMSWTIAQFCFSTTGYSWASVFTARCLCISAVFAVMRCPSVCPSRSWIKSKRINMSEIFSPSGSHTILVFPYQTGCRYSDGNTPPNVPPNGGVECKGVWKMTIFDQYLALSEKRL